MPELFPIDLEEIVTAQYKPCGIGPVAFRLIVDETSVFRLCELPVP